MTIDKQKLKAMAEASPYKDWSLSSYEAVGGRAHIVMHGAFDHIITTFEDGSAEFIAAASPATILALLAEIERLESEAMHTAAGAQSDREQRDQLKAAISSPEAVYLNMKSGAITKPTLRSMADLYGEVVNGEDAQLLEIARLRAENEALRSGHAIKRLSCAEVRETFNQAYYQPREIGSDGEQCRAGVLAVIDAAMAKEASHG